MDDHSNCEASSSPEGRAPATRPDHHRLLRDRGQATTEYALVLLAAALVGLLVIGWATSGGGAAAVGKLFDRVIDSVIDKV
jgi:hypothetical protein